MKNILYLFLLSISAIGAYERECHPETGSPYLPFGGRPYNYTYVDYVTNAAGVKERQICYVMLTPNDNEALRAAYGTFESGDSMQKVLDTVLPDSMVAKVIYDLVKIKEVDSAMYLMVGNLKDLNEKRLYQGNG